MFLRLHCPPCSFLDFYDGADSTPEQRGQCPAGWQPTDDPRDFVRRGGVWDPGTDDLAEREMGGPPGGEHGEAVAVSGTQGTRTRLRRPHCTVKLKYPSVGLVKTIRTGLAMAWLLSRGPATGICLWSLCPPWYISQDIGESWNVGGGGEKGEYILHGWYHSFIFVMVIKYCGGKGLILADNSRLHSHHFGDITGAWAWSKYSRHFLVRSNRNDCTRA